MIRKRTPVREQDADLRISNFEEVCLGYNEDEAVMEAERCLQCKHAPCTAGCPARVRIPDFIKCIKERDFDKAYRILKSRNNLPAVCGRVCPQEVQCEEKCVLSHSGNPIAIGKLERFAADHGMKFNIDAFSSQREKSSDKKIAVAGSGPAGMTCAADLAQYGYKVDIFEALHSPGGVMIYGIPEFRLPKSIVSYEIEKIRGLGVNIRTNLLFGVNYTIEDLIREGYSALFIASGAGLPRLMNIRGEELNHVYSANEFLTRINLLKAYSKESRTPVYAGKRCVVTGGGNVAMDSARCARRLGADVTVLYRRTEKEMPARFEEIEHAKEEGITFCFLSNPVEYRGDESGFVKQVIYEKMKLGAPDSSGRRRPIPTGETETLECDSAVIAIGNSPNPLISSNEKDLKTTEWGTLKVDSNGMTSIPGIFAGGDITTGAATVIQAIGAGKDSAESIHTFISGGGSLTDYKLCD